MPGSSVVHVIDDDGAARDSLSFLLRAARIEVCTYDSAPKFLANIKTFRLGASSPMCACQR